MKKINILVLIPFIFLSCEKSGQRLRRYIENGTEVVENGLKPHKVKGEPSRLRLEESLKIDMEREDISKTGLTDPWAIVVDSEGNIYLANNWRQTNYFIFKFSGDGRFINSFVHRGQGPGELQTITDLYINGHDQIVMSDHMSRKYISSDKEGNIIRESRFVGGYLSSPLGNGKYITDYRKSHNYTEDYIEKEFRLLSPEGKEVKVLDMYKEPNRLKKGYRVLPLNPLFFWKIANDRIFIANEDRAYEILIYDFEGKLLKKIRKEYTPQKIKVSEEIKKKVAKGLEGGLKYYVSEYWPAFQSFFTDDEGRLYVLTYDKDEKSGLYFYDIFNPEGVYIARRTLDIHSDELNVCAYARNNRLYCLQEKESGYKRLVVYSMNWE